jgi:glutamate/aspartate transport system substrate-binding protein
MGQVLRRLAAYRAGAAAFTLSLVLLPHLVLAADTLEKVRANGYITIAYRESSIPFSYLDANKRPIGYAIDICTRLVDAVKVQLRMPRLETRYVAVTPQTRIAAIMDGTADLECGSTTNNVERRKQVAFTIPHYISGSRILVKSDSNIKNIDDLKNRTIVTTVGTTTVKILATADQARGLHFKLIEGKDHAESFAFVLAGTADAFVMDDVLLYSLRATSKDPKATAIVGDFLSVEPYAIMLRRDDPDFKKLVDSTMARLILDYDVTRLYNRWFLSPIPPSGVSLDLPMSSLLRDSFKFPSDAVGD